MYLIEKGRADLAAQLNDALINDRRFKESAKLAGATIRSCVLMPVLGSSMIDVPRSNVKMAHASAWPQGIYRPMCPSLPDVKASLSFEDCAAARLCSCRGLMPGVHAAAALSSLLPVLPLLDCLREAGATVVPEVWHELTTSCMLGGFPVPARKAPICYGE